MFSAEIYDKRRKILAEGIDDGLILLMGNSHVANELSFKLFAF